MNEQASKWRNFAINFLIFLPILSLILNAGLWLRFGIDLPSWDDWRAYLSGDVGSLKIQDLFVSANDTVSPVGKALDALAQRYLDGNAVAYQFFSMVIVLGILLRFQWRLLSSVLRDRLQAAIAFSFTLFMLAPGSYWGLQSLAYHQALPLICILPAIYIVLGRPWNAYWSVPILCILGAISGLSYTSGAFAVLTMGILFLIIGKLLVVAERKPLMQGGIVLFIVGLITSIIQFSVIAVVQKGPHRPDAPFAWPIESDFWFFLLGKVGRSFLLPGGSPVISLIIVSLLVLVLTVLAVLCVSWLVRKKIGKLSEPETRAAIIYLTILSIVFVYLMLIAAGRAHLRPQEINTPTEIFAYGFPRFHFFWATLLWPWMVAASFVVIQKLHPSRIKMILKYLMIVLFIVAIFFIIRGAFKHRAAHHSAMIYRAQNVNCLLSELQKGKGINCTGLEYTDLSKSFVYARRIGASFIRYFPIPPVAFGTDSRPLFRLSKISNKNSVQTLPLSFKTNRDEVLKKCVILDVNVLLRVDTTDVVRLIYKVPTKTGGEETTSQVISVQPKGKQFIETVFQIDSQDGFLDFFRLVPTELSKAVYVKDIEIRCRLQTYAIPKDQM